MLTVLYLYLFYLPNLILIAAAKAFTNSHATNTYGYITVVEYYYRLSESLTRLSLNNPR